MGEDDYKLRINKSILKFSQKFLVGDKPKRRNGKPERDLVQKPVMAYMRSLGWSVEIYEAKAAWDHNSQSYQSNYMKVGTVDCLGCTDSGRFVAVEFKAPGRISTLRDHQRQFLIDKINSGAFGCVTDSVERLRSLYAEFLRLMKQDRSQDAKKFLIRNLGPMRR